MESMMEFSNDKKAIKLYVNNLGNQCRNLGYISGSDSTGKEVS